MLLALFMINYTRPYDIENPSLQKYCVDVMGVRELVTMYQLEHPDYETEEDYGLILEAWKALRSMWTSIAKEEGRDEYLPKPRRRPGRPVNKQVLEERRRAEAERQAAKEAREAAKEAAREARAAREAAKAQERAARAERIAQRERAQKEKAELKRSAIPLALRIPDDVASGIFQIKGDLTLHECVVQLLRHALGPLVDNKNIT